MNLEEVTKKKGEIVNNIVPFRKGPGLDVIAGKSMAEILMMQIGRHADTAPREILNCLLEKLAAEIDTSDFVDHDTLEKFESAVRHDLAFFDLWIEADILPNTIH